ncbi:MAG: hypothetical protein QOG53_2568 [Frankiales bacterium]|jgi:hypothetical protein|nr:hypothetical protein [Frankiales bacterium]
MASTPRCCGDDMREIVIGIPAPTGLLLYLCDVCQRNEWRRNGVPVTAAQALDAARRIDEAVDRSR